MSEPFPDNMDYESDEYYDEQGRRVQEFDYPDISLSSSTGAEQESMMSGGSDLDFAADDSDCGSFQPETTPPAELLSPLPPVVKQAVELPPHPGYSESDMTPTVPDPRCKSDSKLACFWPAYVGNFRCTNRTDEFQSVKEYFAWKGLHVRWWYRQIDDEYYSEFQSKAGIYDMLVYFVSEQDADRAVKMCHRETYKGYPLNVFPGREPVYFDPTRSLQAYKMKSGKVYSELFFEKHVRFGQKVDVTCAVKFELKSGAVEFATAADMEKARKGERLFKFEAVPHNLRKQRFLEHEVLKDIVIRLAFTPGALDVDLKDKYTNMLLRNERPEVDPEPKRQVVPFRSGPTKHTQQRKLQRKRAEIQRGIAKAVQEGREPKCYTKNRALREQFKVWLETAKVQFRTTGKVDF